MLEINNEQICMFDVDDTLIIWDRECNHPGDGRVSIENPYTKHVVYLRPHEGHIRLMKEMRARGRYIGVWSGSGVGWAKAVIAALDLAEYVHLVQTKPIAYVDDLKSDYWLNNHIYLKPQE